VIRRWLMSVIKGVCYSAFQCGQSNGRPVEGVSCNVITPKNTCCQFERTCGATSDETVTYFKVRQCWKTNGDHISPFRAHVIGRTRPSPLSAPSKPST